MTFLFPVTMTLKEANAFIDRHLRHRGPVNQMLTLSRLVDKL